MKTRNFRDLWEEFITLGWSGSFKILPLPLKDIEIGPKVYIRKWKSEWEICYLPIGSFLKIPARWTLIWGEFTVWLGAGWKDLLLEPIPESSIDLFGYRMTQLTNHIVANTCGSNKEWLYEDLIPPLINQKTEEFRDWCKEKFWDGEDQLGPWQLREVVGWKEEDI